MRSIYKVFRMNQFVVLFSMICIPLLTFAQFENSENGLQILRDSPNTPQGGSSTYLGNDNNISKETERKFPLFRASKEDPLGYNRRQSSFSMNEDDGLLDPEAPNIPKYFEKAPNEGNTPLENSRKDQWIGNFESSGGFVTLVYRDHGDVDGDAIRIFLDDDIIKPHVMLLGGFQGLKINLIEGVNKIEIQALNHGTAPPNTAQFQLYDHNGNVLSTNTWNLAAGFRAKMTVTKS